MLVLFAACADPVPPTPPAGEDPTGTPGPATEPERLTVLSLNLHCLKQDGTPFQTLDERLRVVAELVADQGVHVLALQESCKQGDVDAQEQLRQLLQTTTPHEWSTTWYEAHLAWEGTPDEAREGVGLLVRGGGIDTWVIDYVAPGELRRVALAARLAQGPVLVNTHLDYGDEVQREDQARQTATWALALAGGPEAIVAGDLNARAGSPTHTALLDQGFADATPDLDPDRIDHLLVHRGAAWQAASSELVLTDPPVSDHPGVLVHLEPVVPEPVTVTRITAHVDVGFGHHLAVRGDTAPLSWDRGWWAYPAAADRWELVLTELQGPFALKTLIDDVTWQAGEDVAAEAGEHVEVAPSF